MNRKQIGSLLLALLLLTLLPVPGDVAEAQVSFPQIEVGDTVVILKEVLPNIDYPLPGASQGNEGTYNYDDTTNTVTFKNIKITSTVENERGLSAYHVNVVFVGENTIDVKGGGFYNGSRVGVVRISGAPGARLTIHADETGLTNSGPLRMENLNLTINTNRVGISPEDITFAGTTTLSVRS